MEEDPFGKLRTTHADLKKPEAPRIKKVCTELDDPTVAYFNQ